MTQQNSETKPQEADLRIKTVVRGPPVTFEIRDQPDNIYKELVEVVRVSPLDQRVDHICSSFRRSPRSAAAAL